MVHATGFARGANTTVGYLCDVDSTVLAKAMSAISPLQNPAPKAIGDFRRALDDKNVGESCRVRLEPDDAFGDYDTNLMRLEPVDQLPADIAVGGHLVSDQDGNEVVWRITDIADGKAVLDGNHELAGQRLRFDCKVLDIRPATQEEITHGHVHGAHGHHH